ncbi:MAG: hypothetical protein ACREHD_26760, partial [Pirellulales bacterium]
NTEGKKEGKKGHSTFLCCDAGRGGRVDRFACPPTWIILAEFAFDGERDPRFSRCLDDPV